MCVLQWLHGLLCLKANGVWPRRSEMCSAHTNRQDGGGGPRGARFCKRSNVLKVTRLTEDVAEYEYTLASLKPENEGKTIILGSCVFLNCSCLFVDILWWQSGQWATSGSSWSWSWSRSGCRTGSEARHSFHWRSTSKRRLSEKISLPLHHVSLYKSLLLSTPEIWCQVVKLKIN